MSPDVRDYSIWRYFLQIGRKQREYRGSDLLRYRLASLDRFDLPKRFAVVQASTPQNFRSHQQIRNYTPKDWINTIARLERLDLLGVVLNDRPEDVPQSDHLRNLTGQTTLQESFEMVKQCEAYIGIDSCLSVLAAQRLPLDKLMVRSQNDHLLTWRKVYFAPHSAYDFIRPTIQP